MTSSIDPKIRWVTKDLELLPDNDNRYEIIDGELLVTRAPHWNHQQTCCRLFGALDIWSRESKLGHTAVNPGIIFGDQDNLIPDVVWISNARLEALIDPSGHLTGAPELVVEVLSAGTEDDRRDRQVKLKPYSNQGVQEYWIVNWRLQEISVYRRQNLNLELSSTLLAGDRLTSPLLPNFWIVVGTLFV